MVIKLYISGISGNKEVKKKQQRVQMILDSKQIDYEAIDITEPGKEKDKEFMQQNGKVRESLGKYPLPPQIFNDDDFCGDYEDFDLANEVDELEKFLHMATNSKNIENESKQNEDDSQIKEDKMTFKKSCYNPYDYHTFKVKWDNVNGVQEQNSDTNTEKEKEQTEDLEKSEVNGDVEASSKPQNNNFDLSETNEEIPVPVQEEPSEEKQSDINDSAEDEKKDAEGNAFSHNEEEKSKNVENTEENEEKDEKDSEEEKLQTEVEQEETVDKNINESEESQKKEDDDDKENDNEENDDGSPQSEKSEED